MTDREKLMKLLEEALDYSRMCREIKRFTGHEEENPYKTAADYLIEHGVTVLTPDEARNIYTVQEIEKLQGEAYDLGAESVLHNHYGLSWHDAEKVRKEVAKLQSVSKWIPVTERLPKESGEYLAYCGEYDGICVIYYEILKTKSKWRTNWKEVTHWMPLPEPPKEV